MFETEGIEVGITQYGLLGKGSFLYASLGYGLWDSVNENDEGTLRPELLLAIPLSANDALRIRAVSEGRIFTKLDGEEVELREHTFSLSWVRDLTDDPFFPTVGFAATAGIEHAIGDDFAYGLSGTAGGEVTKLRADVTRSALVGSLVQYVRIGTGSSIWGSANLRFGRNDWSERVVGGTEEDRFAGTVRAGWVGGPASWMGNPSYDLRFEAGAVYNYEQWSRTNTLKGNVERAGLRVGVAFRNDWAVIRFVGEWFPHEDYNR